MHSLGILNKSPNLEGLAMSSRQWFAIGTPTSSSVGSCLALSEPGTHGVKLLVGDHCLELPDLGSLGLSSASSAADVVTFRRMAAMLGSGIPGNSCPGASQGGNICAIHQTSTCWVALMQTAESLTCPALQLI